MNEKEEITDQFPKVIYLSEDESNKYKDEPNADDFTNEDVLGVYQLVKKVKIVIKSEIVDA